MVNIIINGRPLSVKEGTTILDAAKENGIKIPTLCYFKDLNEIGACRICVVEIKGSERLSAACNTVVSEGMDILTDSDRVVAARRTNLSLILSQHRCECPTCIRNGNCTLQKLCEEYGILSIPYGKKLPSDRHNDVDPIVKDESKCIKCLRCVNVCEKIQGLGVWQFNGSGAHAKVVLREGLTMADSNCTYCGQCVTHCPVGALYARDDTAKAFAALSDKSKVKVIQIAPAVRAAWGDGLGIDASAATEKRMASAAKALGADYVFDTNFSADLTIMEEGSELLDRIKNGGKMPMFTSCCPGWMRFVKQEYPNLTDNLSTAKSPQQMFGAVAKSYFAKKLGRSPEEIVCISVMPCSAKKYECGVKEINSASGRDVDIVLTTREFTRMLKVKNVDVASLEETEFDSPLGTGSGAAVIFGATGGVMEAALRSAYFLLTGRNPDPDEFRVVRADGNNGIRTAEVTIAGKTVRAAVASGLSDARKICDDVVSGKADYDFIEIMACPGGCAGGGGQPISDGEELASERGARLYAIDGANPIRFSHENPEVRALYDEELGAPLSEKAHALLHTEQKDWTL